MSDSLPDWVFAVFARALLGEIYPAVRAIAVSWSPGKIRIKVYLDREPTDDDKEDFEIVASEVTAMTTEVEVKQMDLEIERSTLPLPQLDQLDGFVFARKEEL